MPKHIPLKDLKVGMVVTCGDAECTPTPSGCWAVGKKAVPARITRIGTIGIGRETLTGEKLEGYCSCPEKDHLYLYEPEPMTNETLTEGAFVKNMSGEFRRVLAVLGGEGDLRLYAISESSRETDSEGLKLAAGVYTAYELTKKNYTPYTETTPVEMTVAEISKKLGVTVKVIE